MMANSDFPLRATDPYFSVTESSDLDRNHLVHQRLTQFIEHFITQFEKKLIHYEAIVSSPVGSSLQTPVELAAGTGLAMMTKVVPISVNSGQSLVNTVIEEVKQRINRKKAKVIYDSIILFRTDKGAFRKILGQASFDIFKSFESPFMRAAAGSSGQERVISKWAHTAVKRAIHHIYYLVKETPFRINEQTTVEAYRTLITQGIIGGNTVSISTVTQFFLNRQEKHTVVIDGHSIKTTDLFERSDLITKYLDDQGHTVYQYYRNLKGLSNGVYRLLLPYEIGQPISVAHYQLIAPPSEERYDYVIDRWTLVEQARQLDAMITTFNNKAPLTQLERHLISLQEAVQKVKAEQGTLLKHIDQLAVSNKNQEHHAPVHYLNTLNEYGIDFKNDKIGLQSFIEGKDQVLHILSHEDPLFGRIILFQLYGQWSEEMSEEEVIWRDLSELLSKVLLDHREVEDFAASLTQNILIMDCQIDESQIDEAKQLFTTLLNVLETDSNKKVVLLSVVENDALLGIGHTFQKLGPHYIQRMSDDFKFSDLTLASQKEQLKKKIVFQGQPVTLGELIGITDLHSFSEQKALDDHIKPKMLLELNSRNWISIGQIMPDVSQLESIYVPRVLSQPIALRPEYFARETRDRFAIIYSYHDWDLLQSPVSDDFKEEVRKNGFAELRYRFPAVESCLLEDIEQHDDARIVVLPAQNIKYHFEQLAKKYPDANWHLLSKTLAEFIWQRSIGQISGLLAYLDTSGYDQYPLSKSANKVAILSGMPGSGKSIFLKFLAYQKKTQDPKLWVIRLDLTQYKHQIDKKSDLSDINTIIDFLVMHPCSEFEPKLLKYYLEGRGQFLLLLDGFDEITENQQLKVIQLVKSLASSKIQKIVLVTRPHWQESLANTFLTIPYSLQPLSILEQSNLLVNFWSRHLGLASNHVRVMTYAQRLMRWFSTSYEKQALVGTPLQLSMLAEIFAKDCHQFYLDSHQEEIHLPSSEDLPGLYERFIKAQYNVYFSKYPSNTVLKAQTLTMVLDSYHEKLAFNTLFPDIHTAELLTESTHLKITDEELLKVGFVYQFKAKQQNMLDFLHSTIAEYFAASHLKYLLEQPAGHVLYMPVREFLWKTLFHYPIYLRIRLFLDFRLVQGSAIHVAVLHGDLEGVRIALNGGADVNALDGQRRTPLHLAAQKNHYEIVNFLLQQSANMRWIDNLLGWHPLHYAVLYKNLAIVELLILNAHTDRIWINYADYRGNTPLHLAVQNDAIAIIQCLLKYNVQINVLNKERQTPLSLTKEKRCWRSAILLLQHEMNTEDLTYRDALFTEMQDVINQVDQRGMTLLHYAAFEGHQMLCSMLMQKNANIAAADRNGNRPIDWAARQGHIHIVQFFLERSEGKLGVEYQNYFGETLLHSAAINGHVGIVEYLLFTRSVNIHATDHHGNTVLHQAVCNNQLAVIQSLFDSRLKNTINIQSINHKGNTPLHEAAQVGSLSIVEFLIFHGAEESINQVNAYGSTALDEAASAGHIDIVRCLLTHQAQLITFDRDGSTPLHAAARSGHLPVLQLLLAHPDFQSRFNVNTLLTRNDHSTLLHEAAAGGHIETIQSFIIHYNAVVDAQDIYGNTPLFDAVAAGQEQIIKVLLYLQPKIDIHKMNNVGETPASLAIASGSGSIVNLLFEYSKHNTAALDHLYHDIYRYQLPFDRVVVPGPSKHFWVKILQQIEAQRDGLMYGLGRENTKRLSGSELNQCFSSSRQKRAVISCDIDQEDIAAICTEQNKPQTVQELRIDHEKFVQHIRRLYKTKQHYKIAQLLMLAKHAPSSGNLRELIDPLWRNQAIHNHFHTMSSFTHWVNYGMITQDVLTAIIRGDYSQVAINILAILSNEALARFSPLLHSLSNTLAMRSQPFWSQLIKMGPTVLGRWTSCFVIYDLAQQIKALRSGESGALVDVITDSLFLVNDGAMIVIEIGESIGWMTGVSAIASPIGLAVSILVIVGSKIYHSILEVDHMEKLLGYLSDFERRRERWRAFLGLKPKQYIQDLLSEVYAHNQLVQHMLQFLSSQHDISRYIVSSIHANITCQDVMIHPRHDSPALLWSSYSRETVETEKCVTKWDPDTDSTVLLAQTLYNPANHVISRVAPNALLAEEGELFCLPQGQNTQGRQERTYYCDHAIGVYKKSQHAAILGQSEASTSNRNDTVIVLGAGRDTVIGWDESPIVFIVEGPGKKAFYGGQENDTFIVRIDHLATGVLDGRGGLNTLLLIGYMLHSDDFIRVHLAQSKGLIAIKQGLPLNIYHMQNVIGEKGQKEWIECDCETRVVNSQGGTAINLDEVVIPALNCSFYLHVIMNAYTHVKNRAFKGQFLYIVPNDTRGNIRLDLIPAEGRNVSLLGHQVVFNYTLEQLQSIVLVDHNETHHAYSPGQVTFSFKSLEIIKGNHSTWTNITVLTIPTTNVTYLLSNNMEIRIAGQHLLALSILSKYVEVEQILDTYAVLAARLGLSMYIQMLNTTITIGAGPYPILCSNALAAVNHLAGSGHQTEIVYVIGAPNGTAMVEGETPKVVIHHIGKNITSTLDLRALFHQNKTTEQDAWMPSPILLSPIGDDLVLVASKPLIAINQGVPSTPTIILHQALRAGWYKTLRIILDKVLLSIQYRSNRFELEPLPLMIDQSKEMIFIMAQDIVINMRLQFAKPAGQKLQFFHLGQDLIVSNVWDPMIQITGFCTIVFMGFDQHPCMQTLSIQFTDRMIRLSKDLIQNQQANISLIAMLTAVTNRTYAEFFEATDAISSTSILPMIDTLALSVRVKRFINLPERGNELEEFSGEAVHNAASTPYSWINRGVYGALAAFTRTSKLLKYRLLVNYPNLSRSLSLLLWPQIHSLPDKQANGEDEAVRNSALFATHDCKWTQIDQTIVGYCEKNRVIKAKVIANIRDKKVLYPRQQQYRYQYDHFNARRKQLVTTTDDAAHQHQYWNYCWPHDRQNYIYCVEEKLVGYRKLLWIQGPEGISINYQQAGEAMLGPLSIYSAKLLVQTASLPPILVMTLADGRRQKLLLAQNVAPEVLWPVMPVAIQRQILASRSKQRAIQMLYMQGIQHLYCTIAQYPLRHTMLGNVFNRLGFKLRWHQGDDQRILIRAWAYLKRGEQRAGVALWLDGIMLHQYTHALYEQYLWPRLATLYPIRRLQSCMIRSKENRSLSMQLYHALQGFIFFIGYLVQFGLTPFNLCISIIDLMTQNMNSSWLPIIGIGLQVIWPIWQSRDEDYWSAWIFIAFIPYAQILCEQVGIPIVDFLNQLINGLQKIITLLLPSLLYKAVVQGIEAWPNDLERLQVAQHEQEISHVRIAEARRRYAACARTLSTQSARFFRRRWPDRVADHSTPFPKEYSNNCVNS